MSPATSLQREDQALPDLAFLRSLDIRGWLSDAERQFLYESARRCTGRGVIVEIGSWCGKSTAHLALGSRRGASKPVLAIDPHVGGLEHGMDGQPKNTFAIFLENMDRAGVSDIVQPALMTSAAAAELLPRLPVELLFIDGDHSYANAREDTDLWLPRVVEGGIVAWHDTVMIPGPYRVMLESVYGNDGLRRVGRVDSITYATVGDGSGLADRIQRLWARVDRRAAETARRVKRLRILCERKH